MPNPTAFSKLEVINQALSALGEEPLSSISELSGTSKQAKVMRIHYEPVIYFCLGLTSWRFATTKASLSKLTAAPANRWSTAWQQPSDMIKLLTTWPPSDYQLANRQILSNESTSLVVDYVRLVEEPYWPAWFMRFVVAELVIRTMKGITGESPGPEERDERKEAQRGALFQDAQQQPNETIVSGAFVDCRA